MWKKLRDKMKAKSEETERPTLINRSFMPSGPKKRRAAKKKMEKEHSVSATSCQGRSDFEKETDQSTSDGSAGSEVLAEGSENVGQKPMAVVEEEVVETLTELKTEMGRIDVGCLGESWESTTDDDDDDEEITVDTNVEEFKALIEMAGRQRVGCCEIVEVGSESDQEENQVEEERLESPLVPSRDVDEYLHHVSETVECPEDEMQPSLAPRAVQRTSWTSCCGLFDVFKGSNS